MSETVKAYFSPPAGARSVLRGLSSEINALADLAIGGMRLKFVDATHCRLIVPAEPSHSSSMEDADRYKRASDLIMAAYSREAEPFSRRLGAQSVDLSLHPGMTAGILMLGLACAREDELGLFEQADIAEPTSQYCLVVVEGEDLYTQLENATSLVRRCPLTRLFVGDLDRGSDNFATLLLVNDDAYRGPTLGGLIARGELDEWRVLSRYEGQAGPIFIPRPMQITRDVVYEMSQILNVCGDGVDMDRASAFGAFDSGHELTLFRTVLPSQDAREVLGGDVSAEGVRWRFLDLGQSENAVGRLRDAIAEVDVRAGYQLTLHPISIGAVESQSLARIRERIVDLEAQVALYHGLNAPQVCLLRFSRTQLPALADFLVKAPVSDIDSGKIRYGFQATAMQPEGVHFLLYDPAEVILESAFPEWAWRERTADDPIRYWVDPHWAAYYAGGRSRVRSRVFTPLNTVLHPTLHSFSPDDMDTYLRDLMIRRVPTEEHTEALRSLLEDRARPTAIVFDRTREQGFELSVEVLDLDQFTPVRQRLDWINDHLLMIDPAIVSDQQISNIAATLFEGRATQTLLTETKERASDLEETALQIEQQFLDQMQGLTKRIDDEFMAVTHQTIAMMSRFETLSTRMHTLENLLEEGQRNFEGVEYAIEGLVGISADIEFQREQLEDGVRFQYEETERFMVAAEARLANAKKTFRVLTSKLEQARNDG